MGPRGIWRSFKFTGPVRFIGDLSHRWLKLISGSFEKRKNRRRIAPHLALGSRGEHLAAHFLRRNWYKILYRNFQSRRGGEIDIVCRDRRANVLVFVEVKSRTTDLFGPPHEAVNFVKQKRIIRAAKEWLRLLNRPDVAYRFDIVEIVFTRRPRCHLIRSAFSISEDIYL
jgi:putative endonuclease